MPEPNLSFYLECSGTLEVSERGPKSDEPIVGGYSVIDLVEGESDYTTVSINLSDETGKLDLSMHATHVENETTHRFFHSLIDVQLTRHEAECMYRALRLMLKMMQK